MEWQPVVDSPGAGVIHLLELEGMKITEVELRIMHRIRRNREEQDLLLPREFHDHQTRK